MNIRRRDVWVALIAAAVTALVFVGALNFTTGEKKIQRTIPRHYGTADAQFERTMGVLLGPSIVGGNTFTVLLNGDQIFPAMLSAIRGARHNINFETYIYWSGEIGKTMAEALSERSRAGVKVNVLLDWLGSSKLDAGQIRQMIDAGVKVHRFHEPTWYHLARLNNRDHRKVLVVDGKVGFTGGVGIADLWTGNAQDPDHWRDTHFRVEGPVVSQMQSVFMDNWIRVTGEVLHGDAYFPRLEPTGDGRAQMFSSSSEGGSESMQLMYLLAVTAATESIHLSMSYFVPDNLATEALVAAAKRGVKIQVITPGEHVDTETVRRASRARWGDLLQAGIRIFEYQPTMYHCKVLIVDGRWVATGSTNFDNRSFTLNDEANLNIYDARFAREQIAVFQQDLARSKEITLAQWQARPWQEKLIEHAASVLGPQL